MLRLPRRPWLQASRITCTVLRYALLKIEQGRSSLRSALPPTGLNIQLDAPEFHRGPLGGHTTHKKPFSSEDRWWVCCVAGAQSTRRGSCQLSRLNRAFSKPHTILFENLRSVYFCRKQPEQLPVEWEREREREREEHYWGLLATLLGERLNVMIGPVSQC